ncbi:MAG: hypothetical protein A2252_08515 [Elusimicrobia bacterium RIFOXYA2_FULL_39_19]|nr:MAG: hypothetical protein A2252_08515 [Elusimicrobia bacterium RIFOXYA2_FULL_39_19]
MIRKNTIKLLTCCVLFMVILLKTSLLFCARLPETVVRIAILKNVSSVNIGCEGDYYYCNLETGNQTPLNNQDIYLIKPFTKGIIIGKNEVFSGEVRFLSKSDAHFIRVNGRRYHDSISIKLMADGKLTVINELGLESYLCGILTREVDPGWPEEALKAQAVVSRTFALKNIDRHKKEGFSLCNEVHCQVYGGLEGEDERTNRAISKTRGEVLVYNKILVNTVFHSCCAGYTEDPKYVWEGGNTTPVYLKGVRCAFCSKCKQYYWSKSVAESIIRKKLNNKGYPAIAKITGIYFKGKTKTGRLKDLRLEYQKKDGKFSEITIRAAKFRLIVDPSVIKSTKISSIKKTKADSYLFTGYGWGHGVGMCQWGAEGMAEKKYKYKEILKHYYPYTEIETWEE